MILSKFMIRVANITLKTIFRSTDADIRVHGLDNIPCRNILYVVNHFTRMETVILPYAIKEHTGQLSLSLASSEFFSESSKKFLNSIGAVSTKDPKRDKILSNALLTGKMSVIIYPEGQMIKDKKLIEKGKLLVYNAGIRRPPHTGAARIALRVELLRQSIKRFHEEGNREQLDSIMKDFDLKEDELLDIVRSTTFIVPVNITYYPIRARNNMIKKLVERFAGKTSGRLAEELEIEGTMLSQGVDIDINFGRALKINKYIKRTGLLNAALRCREQIGFYDISCTSLGGYDQGIAIGRKA